MTCADPTQFASARTVLDEAHAVGAFPAAVCEVGRAEGAVWTEAFGQLTYASDSPETTAATPFDLASLTKVIATTSIVMALVRSGAVRTETVVGDVFPEWRGTDRESITVRHLLDHSSGLPAHVRLPATFTKESARQFLLNTPLERPVRASAVYSDVGFMLLGFLLETVAGRTLDAQWSTLWAGRPDAEHSSASLAYNPDTAQRHLIAPTEVDAARGGLIQGTVHDENAATLGGVAAHAGLFGAAPAVGAFAAWVLRSFRESTWLASPDLMRTMAARSTVPGSSRALGWDTMLPTSSCGTRMSPTAIGHTGFTGTSLWIDWERDRYVVLLTNRIHPTRDNEQFLPYRSRFHDAVAEDLSRTRL